MLAPTSLTSPVAIMSVHNKLKDWETKNKMMMVKSSLLFEPRKYSCGSNGGGGGGECGREGGKGCIKEVVIAVRGDVAVVRGRWW